MVQLHETVKVSCAEETLALSSGKRNSLSYLNQRRSIFGTVRSKSYAVTTSLYNSETLSSNTKATKTAHIVSSLLCK